MRFVDPKNRSPYAFMLEGKIVGLDEHAEAAKKTGKFDYDAKIPGIEASTSTRCASSSRQPTTSSRTSLAHMPFGAVAREVDRGATATTCRRIRSAPGPYMLKEWTRAREDRAGGQSRTIAASPGISSRRTDPWDEDVVTEMKGKKMPQIGRVEITIIEESQSRWLAFSQKELDYLALPATFAPQALDARTS